MEKQQLISLIKESLENGKLSRADIKEMISSEDMPVSKKMSNIFYAIGALIVVIGAVVLISDNWGSIGVVGRVGVTLGLAVITYISAYATRARETISQSMFFISAVLAPIGSFVLANELEIMISAGVHVTIAAILFLVFLVSKLILKSRILILVSIAFGTWTYYSLIMWLFSDSMFNAELMKWATIFLGASYIALGYNRLNIEKRKNVISSLLFALGAFAIMLSFEMMDGFFNLFFILVVFAGFYSSIFLKSRSVLVLSAIFLVSHLIKITGEYFADSISWPIALILLGFVVIGVGYGTIALNRKYLMK